MGDQTFKEGPGLKQPRSPLIKLLLAAVLSGALFALLYLSGLFGAGAGDGFAYICALLSVIYFFAATLIAFQGRGDNLPAYLGVLALAAVSVLLRAAMLDYVSADYTEFLSGWARYFRDHGGFSALSDSVGNYNVPYLYFLALISYIPLKDLYLIKLFSILFDYIMAFYAMKTAAQFTEKRAYQLAVFFAVLFYPTVWLNSAYWAQCDSVYACFVVISLYCALKGKPVLSVAMAAVAFAVKLQAVFFLPVLIVFVIAKRVKIRHLLVFPAVYCAMALPAVIAGRSLYDICAIYASQVDTYGYMLKLNAPTIFAFVPESAPVPLFKLLGICAAALLIIAVYAVSLKNKARLDKRALYAAAILFCVGVPFLLPSMHERYFYLADVAGVIYAAVNTKRWFVPYVILAASYSGYYAYLKNQYLFDLRYAAVLLLVILILLTADFLSALRKEKINRGIRI